MDNENETEFIIRIGNNIDALRKKRGMSYLDLANLADLEKPNVIRVIKARTNATARTLFRLASALKVAPKDLLK